MASAAVRFHPAAAQEAEFTYDWYAARNRARRYLFPRYPLSLVYIVRGDDLEVIAVAHGRRRPGYWRARL